MAELTEKTYHGYRRLNAAGHSTEVTVNVCEPGREPRLLNLRHDLRLHSTSFEWGYGGSGPAQLALALAADVLGDDGKAQDVYQRLKFKLIGGLPHEGWMLTEKRIRAAIAAIEQEQGRPR
jgi:hypothetical protein